MRRVPLVFLALMIPLSAKADPIDVDGRRTGTLPGPATPSPTPVTRGSPSDSDVGAEPNAPEQVIAEDLIVQGDLCVGIGCAANEPLGGLTMKLKTNQIRLLFEDDSLAGNPSNDWALVGNDNAGTSNYFAIQDATASTVPFRVRAGAVTDTLVADTQGRVGVNTASPVLKLHVTDTDTPDFRMEQTNAGGFTAQTWDIGANEANFFVRDVTGGSRLPFRIRPGALSSSIEIRVEGVAMHGDAANSKLNVYGNAPGGAPISAFRITNASLGTNAGFDNEPVENRFEVDSDGNVMAKGAITQLSSRLAKENLLPVDGRSILERLTDLPVLHWNYLGAPAADRHLGPTAEDFHAAFGLGDRPTTIAVTDLAGVALAAVQELNAQVRERDARIAEQEARLQSLEARLLRLESAE